MHVEFRPLREDERDQARSLRAAAFGLPTPTGNEPVDGETMVLAEAGTVLAVMAYDLRQQFVAGSPVPCATVRSVAVAPHARGRGLGVRLMRECLEVFRERGAVLSTLFPSTRAPYRAVGYEPAGDRVRHTVDLEDLPLVGPLPVEPAVDADAIDMAGSYERWAGMGSGQLARSAEQHARVWEPPSSGGRPTPLIQRVAVRQEGRMTGYAVFTTEAVPGPEPVGHRYVPGDAVTFTLVACRDLVAETPAALVSLLAHLQGFRALSRVAAWTGPASDPRVSLLRTSTSRITSHIQWMSAIVDLPGAISQRPFAGGLHREITLSVVAGRDGQDAGTWHVTVDPEGEGHAVATAPRGEPPRIHARGLASLYTGYATAEDLVLQGLLEGATPGQAATLTSAFRTSSPWMHDMF